MRFAAIFVLVAIVVLTVVSTPVLLIVRRFYRTKVLVDAYTVAAWLSVVVSLVTFKPYEPTVRWTGIASLVLVLLLLVHPLGPVFKGWIRMQHRRRSGEEAPRGPDPGAA